MAGPITADKIKGLKTANEALRQVAVSSFVAAFTEATKAFDDNGGPKDETAAQKQRRRAEYEAGVAKAKTDMTSALQQLVQADITNSERTARKSYRALARLIKTIGTGALTNLASVTPAPGDEAAVANLLNAHAALLQALANLAPVATWPGARLPGSG